MEIQILKENKKTKLKGGFIFVRLNNKEAISLIHSLTEQMIHNNPNVGRLESLDIDGNYFSISVEEIEVKNKTHSDISTWYKRVVTK